MAEFEFGTEDNLSARDQTIKVKQTRTQEFKNSESTKIEIPVDSETADELFDQAVAGGSGHPDIQEGPDGDGLVLTIVGSSPCSGPSPCDDGGMPDGMPDGMPVGLLDSLPVAQNLGPGDMDDMFETITEAIMDPAEPNPMAGDMPPGVLPPGDNPFADIVLIDAPPLAEESLEDSLNQNTSPSSPSSGWSVHPDKNEWWHPDMENSVVIGPETTGLLGAIPKRIIIV